MICSFCGTKKKKQRMSAKDVQKIKPKVLKYLQERLDSGSDIDNKVVFSLFYPVKESTLVSWIYTVKPIKRKAIMLEIRELLIRNKSIDNKILYQIKWKISKRTLLRWMKIVKEELKQK